MELILVILCFRRLRRHLPSGVRFGQTDSRPQPDLSAAVLAADNAAECWKASARRPGECAAFLNVEEDGNTLILTFDIDWQLTDGNVEYRLYLKARMEKPPSPYGCSGEPSSASKPGFRREGRHEAA
jgi:hypothetical protein